VAPHPPDDPRRAVPGVAITLIVTLGASAAAPLLIAVAGLLAMVLLVLLLR
jgi:hypothetical protein